jgi:hypothetical protein
MNTNSSHALFTELTAEESAAINGGFDWNPVHWVKSGYNAVADVVKKPSFWKGFGITLGVGFAILAGGSGGKPTGQMTPGGAIIGGEIKY